MPQLEISKNITMDLPEEYQLIPADVVNPDDGIAYGLRTENATCAVLISEIPFDQAMPLDRPDIIIHSIHHYLADDQGLIEVNSGHTTEGRPYAYSIVKSVMERSGVQYIVTLQIAYENSVLNVQSYDEEYGTTGMREALVYAMARNAGRITDSGFEGWDQDPYDPEYKQGILRNLSEDPQFDAKFPAHPLSVARSLCRYLIEHN